MIPNYKIKFKFSYHMKFVNTECNRVQNFGTPIFCTGALKKSSKSQHSKISKYAHEFSINVRCNFSIGNYVIDYINKTKTFYQNAQKRERLLMVTQINIFHLFANIFEMCCPLHYHFIAEILHFETKSQTISDLHALYI